MEQVRGQLAISHDISGEVSLSHLPRSRGVRSFVEKRIKGWLFHEGFDRPWTKSTAVPSFHVRFERQGEGHLVACWMEIRIGGNVWRSARVGPGIQQAFLQALNHLIPIHPLPASLALSHA